MHLSAYLTSALALASTTNALSIPQEFKAIAVRSAAAVSSVFDSNVALDSRLERRKGGGGKGGSSSSSSKSGSSSSSSSSSSSRTSSSSNQGGATKSGSGTRPSYGGGRYYSGGAAVPYAAGARSPLGIAPFFLAGSLLAFWPALWLYGAYSYPYTHPYNFMNTSAANSTFPNGVNTTLPVNCLCAQYAECGCDDNTDSQFMNSIIGNGSYSALNSSVVIVTNVNGTKTIAINGTLANGTTASGGTDDAAGMLRAPYQAGLWLLAGIVGYAVMSI